jgi:glycosyltransferase involved in cell wall biosynthesis
LRVQISVVIITKNEEENLKRSLPKLYWCEDIVVVDDQSTDHTVSIAESFGCKVHRRVFDGFGRQKQFAVSQAQFQWVLNIDADEVLSDDLIEELKQLDLEHTQYSGFMIPIRHVFMGRVFKYGKESRYYHLRLFNKTKGSFNHAAVHEKVELSGPVKQLSNVILHYSYRDLDHYFQKFNTYTSVGAKKLKEQKKSRSLLLCLAAFPVYFVKHFFFYGNILNGRQGFIWSYLNAWYHTVKYLKLNELNQKK